MIKQKIYKTKDGQKVVATFGNSHVHWYIEGRKFSNTVDPILTFYNKIDYRQWEEIKLEKSK